MIGKAILLFILFVVLMTEWSEAGLPPTTIKGQSGSKITTFNFEVPNNQATKTSTGSLIVTGNKNLLSNPGFEHSTVTTGWTAGGFFNVTKTATTGIDGAQALLYTFDATGTTLELTQDSTINEAAFADGVQGLAMVRVKTSVSGLKVCSRQAGTTSTTNCVNVNNDNKWGLYKVPFILGATSNGISIHSDGATITSNTVTIDDAFVGAVDLKQEISQCFDASCTDTFSAKVSSADAVSDESIEWITGNCTDATTGQATCNFASGVFTVAPNCKVSGTTAGVPGSTIDSVSATSVALRMISTGGSYTNGGFVISCQKQGADYTSAQRAKVGNVYTAQNADTDWASCGHTTSDFTGFGTVTNIETQCKRQGSDLLMKGKFTSGTTTATEARLALKLSGVSLTSANTTKIPSIQASGDALVSTQATTYFRSSVLSEPSVNYVTFGNQTSTGNALSKMLGTSFSNGNVMSFNARIPINGWEQSNVIIGSFNDFNYVHVEATSDSAFAIGTVDTDMVFEDEVKDTDNAYNHVTGIFTVPAGKSGLYKYTSEIQTAAVNLATNHRLYCKLVKNGSIDLVSGRRSIGSGVSMNHSSGVSVEVSLVSGDTLVTKCTSNVATTAIGQAFGVRMTITRIPGQFP